MWEYLLGLFLIAHGLVHIFYGIPRPGLIGDGPRWPFDLSHSWILNTLHCNEDTCRSVGTILWTIATLGFVSAGMSLLEIGLVETSWVSLALAASVVSFIHLSLFWDRWLIMGMVLDAGIIAALAR